MMLEEKLSREQLLLELESLRQEVEDLKREKADLEILLETTTEHSDTVELVLLGQAESALRESAERFRAIAEATPVPVVISRACDGEVLYANPQSEPAFGLPTQEIIGRHTGEFYHDPADRQVLLDRMAKDGCVRNYEVRAKKADGTPFWAMLSIEPLMFNGEQTLLSAFYDITERKAVEETMQTSERRLRVQSQALLELGRERTLSSDNLNAAIRQITEVAARTLEVERVSVWLYKETRESGFHVVPAQIHCLDLYELSCDRHTSGMELATIDYPAYFQALSAEQILAAPDAYKDPRTLEFSGSYLSPFGITSMLDVPIRLGGQIVGIICYEDTGAPRQWALEEENFADSLTNLVALAIEGFERRRAQEGLSRAKQELEIKVEKRTAELRDAVEQLRFEIAERIKAESALQEAVNTAEAASRAKSTFLANMSHELRTPLNAIIGYSEMLEEELADRELNDLLPDMEKIRTAGKHLLALINDILDLSKIEAGRMKLYLETFDPATLVDEVVTTLSPLVEKNRNTLEVSCPTDLGLMRADLTKVRQVLLNLLSNAVKFTHQGLVTLTVTRKPVGSCDWFDFQVTDSGIGMSGEQMLGLFQPFMQGDASTTRKYGGTGLGLAISQRLCQMMGGEISVDSQPGVGSTFTVHLAANVAEFSDRTVYDDDGPN